MTATRNNDCSTAGRTAYCPSSITAPSNGSPTARLDHDPAHDDIREFFSAFRAAWAARGLLLEGITTDGSPLYPQPIAVIFPGVRPQVCEFHVLAEITKAGLRPQQAR